MARYPLADNGKEDVAALQGLLSVSICCGPAGLISGHYVQRPVYGWVYRLESSGLTAKLTIRLVIKGNYKDAEISIPRAEGLHRVPVTGEGVTGWATARGSLFPEGFDDYFNWEDGELEPSTIAWANFGVTSFKFFNEERVADPRQRSSLSITDLNYDLGKANESVRFKSGYNCELSYDALTGELTIDGSPGEGEGLPEEAYWDTPPVEEDDTRPGLLTVNGFTSIEGDIPLEFGEGISVSRGVGSLTLEPV